MENNIRMGIDIGSTTIKMVIVDEGDQIIFEAYRRHLSNIKNMIVQLFNEAYEKMGDLILRASVTGSGGLMIAE